MLDNTDRSLGKLLYLHEERKYLQICKIQREGLRKPGQEKLDRLYIAHPQTSFASVNRAFLTWVEDILNQDASDIDLRYLLKRAQWFTKWDGDWYHRSGTNAFHFWDTVDIFLRYSGWRNS